jgi:hypothetical protein
MSVLLLTQRRFLHTDIFLLDMMILPKLIRSDYSTSKYGDASKELDKGTISEEKPLRTPKNG